MGSTVITTDMIIIGTGPVGLFAIFEAGLLGLECHLIDNLDRPGGQCTELYPEKPIYDIPSRPHVTGQQLVEDLMTQVSPFNPVFHLGQQAETLEKRHNGHWRVTTTRGITIDAPIIVIAVGAGSFVAKKPPYGKLAQFEQKSVDYAIHKMEKYRNKALVIVGGGDSALDWAITLSPLAKRVTLVHRRLEFRGARDSVQQLHDLTTAGSLDVIYGNITNLTGDEGRLSTVSVTTLEGEIQHIACDYLLPFMGLKVKLGPIAEWGLNLDKKHVAVNPETFETTQKGIYAIGDVCTYPGKIKLILTGFYEAAVMTRAAFRYAYPDRKIMAGYTTTNSALQERLGVAGK